MPEFARNFRKQVLPGGLASKFSYGEKDEFVLPSKGVDLHFGRRGLGA